jgi:arginase
MKVDVIAVPFDSGKRNTRMGRGPEHLLDLGLANALERAGATVRVITVEPSPEMFQSEISVAGDLQRSVARHVANARRVGAWPLIISGNCNTAVGTVTGLIESGGSLPVVCWLDAHADFNTPETSISGFLDGMALATLAWRCWRPLTERIPGYAPVPDSQIVTVGVRHVDPLELELLNQSSVHRVPTPFDLRDFEKAVASAGTDRVDQLYLHVDLDVFDPSEGRANGYATENGLTRSQFATLAASLGKKSRISAAALTSYDPEYDSDDRIGRLAIEIAVTLAEML